MGLVVLAGLTMFVLVLTGFRAAVFDAVPESLKTAIVVGIGLFIALIGLVNSGFVRRIPDTANTTVPVGLGFGGVLIGWPTLVFVFGLVLTMALVVRRVRGGILMGVLCATVLAVVLEAVAPALVVVGVMMVAQVGRIDFEDWASPSRRSSPSLSCRSPIRSRTVSERASWPSC